MKRSIGLFAFLYLLSSFTPAFSQKGWSGSFKLSSLDCDSKQVCYKLLMRGTDEEGWYLGDQNYRLFYDASVASPVEVKSLLPEGKYGKPQIQEELEIINQGQEAYSPLDLIDEHLGFLDVSIISYTKESPLTAERVSNQSETEVAEFCFSVSDELLEKDAKKAMNLYFSRPETAGQITRQYTLVSEIDGVSHTSETRGVHFRDMTYASSSDSRPGELCEKATSGISLEKREGLLSIYPNPVSSDGNINYEVPGRSLGEHDISIYDLNNRRVASYEGLDADNKVLELKKKLSSGTYFIHVKSQKSTYRTAFTIMRR